MQQSCERMERTAVKQRRLFELDREVSRSFPGGKEAFEVEATACAKKGGMTVLFFFLIITLNLLTYLLTYLLIYLFIYLFIYGCVGSSFLCEGFL